MLRSSCWPVAQVTVPTNHTVHAARAGKRYRRRFGHEPEHVAGALVLHCAGNGGRFVCRRVRQGELVPLVATPNAESIFAGWSGACGGTGQCIVDMSREQSVTATFTAAALGPCELTVALSGQGSGTVSSTPGGVGSTLVSGTASGQCTATFAPGTEVTLRAAANGFPLRGGTGRQAGRPPLPQHKPDGLPRRTTTRRHRRASANSARVGAGGAAAQSHGSDLPLRPIPYGYCSRSNDTTPLAAPPTRYPPPNVSLGCRPPSSRWHTRPSQASSRATAAGRTSKP